MPDIKSVKEIAVLFQTNVEYLISDADVIYPLLSKKRLSLIENIVDFITSSGIFDLYYQLNNVKNI